MTDDFVPKCKSGNYYRGSPFSQSDPCNTFRPEHEAERIKSGNGSSGDPVSERVRELLQELIAQGIDINKPSEQPERSMDELFELAEKARRSPPPKKEMDPELKEMLDRAERALKKNAPKTGM